MSGLGERQTTSALTPELRDEIAKRLASGATLETAAESVGVTRRTVQRWLAAGREAEERAEAGRRLTAKERACLELLEAERQARAENEIRLLLIVQRGAQEDPRLALMLLERLHPERYAPRGRGVSARPNAGRPLGTTSAPDRQPPPRPGVLRRVA